MVVQRELEQWFFKITDYADRLDAGLDTLEHWPEKVKLMQRNWIGRSVGADVEFPVPSLGKPIRIFTTRPDTIYGATFMVLAPEHPDVAALIADHPDRAEIEQWIAGVRNQIEPGAAGGGEGRALHRQDGDQSVHERGDPDLARQLRADAVRHRRDHGRAGARPARLRVRDSSTACRSASSSRRRDGDAAERPDRSVRAKDDTAIARRTPASSTACRRRKRSSGSSTRSSAAASARRWSATGCATG